MKYIQSQQVIVRLYIVMGLFLGGLLLNMGSAEASLGSGSSYNPTIHPSDFSTTIDNKYFSLPIGSKLEFKGETKDGTETSEVTITGKTKVVMGVKTLVYRDKVWLDGELIEDTNDYLAQDSQGNVWYFGEDVKNYENGKLIDTHGSWLAGVDGALPGIWMEANPKVGDEYRQEYYKGEAEDTGTIVSLSEKVKVPAGTFTHCLQTLDQNPLEPRSTDEYKYFCPKVKGLSLETDTNGDERVELLSTTVVDSAPSTDPKIARLELIVKLLKQVIALLIQQRAL